MSQIAVVPPARRLRPCNHVPTMQGMASQTNLRALSKLGDRRRRLRAELEVIDGQIDEQLRVTYPEGWAWDVLMSASSLTNTSLSGRLKRLGLVAEKSTRPRGRAATKTQPKPKN